MTHMNTDQIAETLAAYWAMTESPQKDELGARISLMSESEVTPVCKFAAHYEDAWNTPWPLSNLKVKINNKLVAEEY